MGSVLDAHRAYLNDIQARQANRRKLVDPTYSYPALPPIDRSGPASPHHDERIHQAEAGVDEVKADKANVVNYRADEETIRNDYTEWYGVSGKSGADYILGAKADKICEEYFLFIPAECRDS